MKPGRAVFFLGAVAAVAFAVSSSRAQRVDPRRPATFVVGRPRGASPTPRVDAQRTGMTLDALPANATIAWRKSLGLTIDQPALAIGDGSLAVVTSRGDVVFLDEAGEERSKISLGAGSIGAATSTSDGTIVFSTSAGDAVGIRRGLARPRFSNRIGGDRNLHAAPLALNDGGVVLATQTDLVALDAEGNLRTRVSLPEMPAAPLVAWGDEVVAVTSSGAVYGWAPGREATRIASFGAAVDGGVALLPPSTLVAVIEGNHLVDLDLAHGTQNTRAIAVQGIYLGPPSVRVHGTSSFATILAMTPSRGFVLTVDATGQETLRAPIAVFTPTILPDGGTAALVPPSHNGALVDPRGAVAFATMDGHPGVVSVDGQVDTAGETPCARNGRGNGVVGLTPYGKAAFVVTCEGGVIVKITSH